VRIVVSALGAMPQLYPSALKLRDLRAPAADSRRLLERVRELQQREIVAVSADDLNPDRQPLGRESGRH
jgi:hypothetical protein